MKEREIHCKEEKHPHIEVLIELGSCNKSWYGKLARDKEWYTGRGWSVLERGKWSGLSESQTWEQTEGGDKEAERAGLIGQL
jgi:hypothetical protein